MKSSVEESAGNDGKPHLSPFASEFIAFVSHQVRSPLASVKGYADLIVSGHYGPVSAEVLSIIKRIKSSAERAMDLANNLLDLKKIEEGKMEYRFDKVDLNKIVGDAVDELQLLADRKKIDLIFTPQEEAAIVSVDAQHIHQVVQNLIDNAIKYTPSGWVKAEITYKKDSFIITVSDSGRGIKVGATTVIFDKFIRGLKGGEVIRGSGLGLFIAKTIVEAHKGKIWAESEGEGKGSTFYVSLPAA